LGNAAEYLASVFEDLGLERMEIDCMELKGPAFENWDRTYIHAHLAAGGYCEAVVFPAEGPLVPCNELLYKRAVVLAPGRFESVEQMHTGLVQGTLAELPEEELKESKGGLGLFCLSISAATAGQPGASTEETVKHAMELQKLGYGVMVFRTRELYEMSTFVNRYTKSRIHFATGLTVLVNVLEDSYKDLAGSLLEAIARLFSQNVRLSVYPMEAQEVERRVKLSGLTGWKWEESDGLVHADELHPDEPLDFLYQYLLGRKFILPGKPPAN
jgi:hypothetical protein